MSVPEVLLASGKFVRERGVPMYKIIFLVLLWVTPVLSMEPEDKFLLNSSIHEAAVQGNVDRVKSFLKLGTDVNLLDKERRAPLHCAVGGCHAALVNFLLSVPGIDVNIPNLYKARPLHFAAYNGDDVVTKMLLAAQKININMPTRYGMTALHIAVHNGHEAVVKALLGHSGISVAIQDEDGQTPLMVARRFHHAKIMSLIENYLLRNAKPASHLNAELRQKAWQSNVARIKELIHLGADTTAPDESGMTALHLAAQRGNVDVVKILINAPRLQVNARDKNGRTLSMLLLRTVKSMC